MARVEELTPHGRGGVSILAVSGSDARGVVARLVPDLALESGAPPRLVRLRHRASEGSVEELDEALVWRRLDGAVELHLHGSPVLVSRIRELLEATTESANCSGAEGSGLLPSRGELERRAARALEDAPTVAAARLLLDQAEGALREALRTWLELEDRELRASLAGELRARGHAARWLLEPARLVLAGPVNAGKSTLFNLLVGAERVVVSGVPGTTRDVIEERVRIGAYAVDLVDTAGGRQAAGPAARVERAGQSQALQAARDASLVFWISRGERPPELGTRVVEFLGRADEPVPTAHTSVRPLAPLVRPREALQAVETAFLEALGLPASPYAPGRAVPFDRHSRALAESMECSPELTATRDAVRAALS
jgi:tRNA modification GTPase